MFEKEKLEWHNVASADLPAPVLKTFNALIELENKFKSELEKALRANGHMNETQRLAVSRKGERISVAFPKANGGNGASLKFK